MILRKGCPDRGQSVALQLKDSIFVGNSRATGSSGCRPIISPFPIGGQPGTQRISSNRRPAQLEELEEKAKTLEAKAKSLETLEGKGEAYGSGFTEYRFYFRHEGKAK